MNAAVKYAEFAESITCRQDGIEDRGTVTQNIGQAHVAGNDKIQVLCALFLQVDDFVVGTGSTGGGRDERTFCIVARSRKFRRRFEHLESVMGLG
jgi:hypothetical protein